MIHKRTSILIMACLLLCLLIFAACKGSDSSLAPPQGNLPEEAPSSPEETPSTPDNSTSDDVLPPEVTPPKPPEPTPPPKPVVYYDTLIKSVTDGLTVRSGPGTNYSSVGRIDKDDMISFIDLNNGWYKTVYKEKTAYISANAAHTKLVKFEKSKNPTTEKAIEIGEKLLGLPYVYGAERIHWGNGALNSKFTGYSYDCSSLTQYVTYKSNYILLKGTSREQSLQGKYVSRNDLKRGDLMFFTNASRQHLSGIERIGHVGIYLGDNYILHTASDYAVIEPISSARWNNFITARDVFN